MTKSKIKQPTKTLLRSDRDDAVTNGEVTEGMSTLFETLLIFSLAVIQQELGIDIR